MRASELSILIILIISFAIPIYLYPGLPDDIVSHWNAAGEVDGYMPKFWGLFLTPMIGFGMLLLFMVIPRVDPLKANIKKFRGYFDAFIVIMILFLFYLQLIIISWSLGFRFDIIQMMSPAFAIIFYYAGILIEHTKRNWFIGIRTPWTLSSDRVWNKTHKRGAKLFKLSGAIILFGVLFPDIAMYFILIPILLSSFYLIVYSYFEYKKEKKK